MNILFVCTGNTCRSPMAEALAKEMIPDVNVQSAGIFAFEGAAANDNAIHVLQEENIHFHHESQLVTESLISWADLVLTMTRQHKDILTAQYEAEPEKIFTLKEYTSSSQRDWLDIIDPFGGDIPTYHDTLNELRKSMIDLKRKLEKEGK